jgi:hypothetical protein
MNYSAIYNRIIAQAKIRNLAKGGFVIVESHHIVPRSCGGSNLKENKVNLTLREHYVCHVLLEKIYRNTEFHAGMCRAVVAMNQRGGISSQMYQLIREKHIFNLRNQTISESQKSAISKANKGNKSRTGLIHSIETKQKISESLKGRRFSEETLKLMSATRKGRTPWNKGVTGYKMTKKTKGVVDVK